MDSSSDSAATPGTSVGIKGGQVKSADGQVRLEIPDGTLAKDTDFSIKSASSAPPGHVGTAYEISPGRTKFAKPATLTITYKAGALPPAWGQTSQWALWWTASGSPCPARC